MVDWDLYLKLGLMSVSFIFPFLFILHLSHYSLYLFIIHLALGPWQHLSSSGVPCPSQLCIGFYCKLKSWCFQCHQFVKYFSITKCLDFQMQSISSTNHVTTTTTRTKNLEDNPTSRKVENQKVEKVSFASWFLRPLFSSPENPFFISCWSLHHLVECPTAQPTGPATAQLTQQDFRLIR